MKVAVSIPDEIFAETEHLAKPLKTSSGRTRPATCSCRVTKRDCQRIRSRTSPLSWPSTGSNSPSVCGRFRRGACSLSWQASTPSLAAEHRCGSVPKRWPAGTLTHRKPLDGDEEVAEAARFLLSLRRNHGCGALWFSSQVAHPRDHGGRSGGEALGRAVSQRNRTSGGRPRYRAVALSAGTASGIAFGNEHTTLRNCRPPQRRACRHRRPLLSDFGNFPEPGHLAS